VNRGELVSNSCIRLVKMYLKEIGVEIKKIHLGEAHISYNATFNAMVRNSDYLVERFSVSYQYLME
jgi:hypothetical protein